ncbi:GNAT family N-acetyltransferase [Nocardiopsis terrae]
MPTAPTSAATRPQDTTAWRIDNLTGTDVLSDLDPWVEIYEEVYAHALHLPDHNDPPFRERLAFSAARPGFRLTSCHADGEPAAFVYGYTLPTTTGWWDGFTPAPDVEDDLAHEWPGRTFGVCEALIRTPYRRSGLAERMAPFLLSGRDEERAAGLVAETNTHALEIFLRNGWRQVGDLAPHAGWRRHHCLVLPLNV